MKKILDICEYIQLRIAALFLFVFIVCIILQVLTRYVPGFSLPWTEEIANYSFIWSMLLGAAVMVKEKAHYNMEIISEKLTGRVGTANKIFVHALVAVFGAVVAYYGVELTGQFWNWSVNSLPILSQRYVWMVLPVTGFTMCLYSIGNIWGEIANPEK
ncbi:MAG: TRAP transporter small permease [Bacillota bacterium]